MAVKQEISRKLLLLIPVTVYYHEHGNVVDSKGDLWKTNILGEYWHFRKGTFVKSKLPKNKQMLLSLCSSIGWAP